ENFRFDILGSRNSPWNKSAARVFADMTIHQLRLPNTVQMFDALRHAFAAHLERITRRYQLSQKSKMEQNHLQSLGRRQARKYQLFHQRRYLAYTFEPLQQHIDMLEALGVDEMSSDESETEDAGIDASVEYHILSPRWRARLLSGWLWMFDALHHILQ
ncbi:hypothetical protein DFH09DRAFT_845427, partial [Mycena vulgaris]